MMVAERVPGRVLDRRVVRLERSRAWQRVHRLGQITETSAIVGRPDWAQQAGSELQHLATRQIALLARNGDDCA